jgi:general stress protein CsbA
MTSRSPDARRISSLLSERRVSSTAMAVVLSIALLFGLVGFAFHTLWIIAILMLALGLGYVMANARQDRRDVVDHR